VPRRRFRGPRGPGAPRREPTDEYRRGPSAERGPEPLINIASAERAAIDLSPPPPSSPLSLLRRVVREIPRDERFSRSCRDVGASCYSSLGIHGARSRVLYDQTYTCTQVYTCTYRYTYIGMCACTCSINLAVTRIARAPLSVITLACRSAYAPINESRLFWISLANDECIRCSPGFSERLERMEYRGRGRGNRGGDRCYYYCRPKQEIARGAISPTRGLLLTFARCDACSIAKDGCVRRRRSYLAVIRA